MIEALLDIKHWGNSLGVRLPAKVARAAHFQAEQRVRVHVADGRVAIDPCRIRSCRWRSGWPASMRPATVAK